MRDGVQIDSGLKPPQGQRSRRGNDAWARRRARSVGAPPGRVCQADNSRYSLSKADALKVLILKLTVNQRVRLLQIGRKRQNSRVEDLAMSQVEPKSGLK